MLNQFKFITLFKTKPFARNTHTAHESKTDLTNWPKFVRFCRFVYLQCQCVKFQVTQTATHAIWWPILLFLSRNRNRYFSVISALVCLRCVCVYVCAFLFCVCVICHAVLVRVWHVFIGSFIFLCFFFVFVLGT